MKYQEDQKLKLYIRQYRKTKNKEILERIYIILQGLVKAFLIKYHKNYLINTGIVVEQLAADIAADLVLTVMKKRIDVYAWGKYLGFYVKKYVYLKSKFEELETNDVVGEEGIDVSDLNFRQLISVFVEDYRKHNTVFDNKLSMLILYLCLFKLERENLRFMELKPRRMGCILSFWRIRFYRLLKKELRVCM